MKTTDYQEAKQYLRRTAKNAKYLCKNDSPKIRMIINDTCDFLCKEYQFSNHFRMLLENYSCKLHP